MKVSFQQQQKSSKRGITINGNQFLTFAYRTRQIFSQKLAEKYLTWNFQHTEDRWIDETYEMTHGRTHVQTTS